MRDDAAAAAAMSVVQCAPLLTVPPQLFYAEIAAQLTCADLARLAMTGRVGAQRVGGAAQTCADAIRALNAISGLARDYTARLYSVYILQQASSPYVDETKHLIGGGVVVVVNVWCVVESDCIGWHASPTHHPGSVTIRVKDDDYGMPGKLDTLATRLESLYDMVRATLDTAHDTRRRRRRRTVCINWMRMIEQFSLLQDPRLPTPRMRELVRLLWRADDILFLQRPDNCRILEAPLLFCTVWALCGAHRTADISGDGIVARLWAMHLKLALFESVFLIAVASDDERQRCGGDDDDVKAALYLARFWRVDQSVHTPSCVAWSSRLTTTPPPLVPSVGAPQAITAHLFDGITVADVRRGLDAFDRLMCRARSMTGMCQPPPPGVHPIDALCRGVARVASAIGLGGADATFDALIDPRRAIMDRLSYVQARAIAAAAPTSENLVDNNRCSFVYIARARAMFTILENAYTQTGCQLVAPPSIA